MFGWSFLRLAIVFQGIYYFTTGLWPFLSLDSFFWLVGPKSELFLLHTIAGLIVAVSLSFLAAALWNQIGLPVVVLSIANCFTFMIVEVYYRNTIRPIYLADTAVESLIVVAVVVGLLLQTSSRHMR